MEKRERQLITEFGHAFKTTYPDAFWFKIPDAPTKKQVAKPYDVECTFNAIPIGIEFKYSRTHPRDIATLLRPSQVTGLTQKVKAGGRGYIVIEVDKTTRNEGRKRYIIVQDWESKLTHEFDYSPSWSVAVNGLAGLFVVQSKSSDVEQVEQTTPSVGCPVDEEFDF